MAGWLGGGGSGCSTPTHGALLGIYQSRGGDYLLPHAKSWSRKYVIMIKLSKVVLTNMIDRRDNIGCCLITRAPVHGALIWLRD